jgi:hypothetical protein
MSKVGLGKVETYTHVSDLVDKVLVVFHFLLPRQRGNDLDVRSPILDRDHPDYPGGFDDDAIHAAIQNRYILIASGNDRRVIQHIQLFGRFEKLGQIGLATDRGGFGKLGHRKILCSYSSQYKLICDPLQALNSYDSFELELIDFVRSVTKWVVGKDRAKRLTHGFLNGIDNRCIGRDIDGTAPTPVVTIAIDAFEQVLVAVHVLLLLASGDASLMTRAIVVRGRFAVGHRPTTIVAYAIVERGGLTIGNRSTLIASCRVVKRLRLRLCKRYVGHQ